MQIGAGNHSNKNTSVYVGRLYLEVTLANSCTVELNSSLIINDMALLDTTLHKDLLGSFISDLILQVLAYVAQQERENIKQRQAEGIAIAKAKGKHLGRPKAEMPKDFAAVYLEWKDGHITAKKAMAELGLKTTTFYKFVKHYEGRE